MKCPLPFNELPPLNESRRCLGNGRGTSGRIPATAIVDQGMVVSGAVRYHNETFALRLNAGKQ